MFFRGGVKWMDLTESEGMLSYGQFYENKILAP